MRQRGPGLTQSQPHSARIHRLDLLKLVQCPLFAIAEAARPDLDEVLEIGDHGAGTGNYALERFSALARSRVLIIFSIGTPHLLLDALSQALDRGPFIAGAGPDHVVWGLQALGVLPWVEPFSVRRKLQFADLPKAARELGRTLGLEADEHKRAIDALASLLQPVATGWEYPYTLTIPLIYWDPADLRVPE